MDAEFRDAALKMNADIKMIYKKVDAVGYKTSEGRDLLNQVHLIYVQFAEIWGRENLLTAKFITHSKSSAHRTICNKRSRDDY